MRLMNLWACIIFALHMLPNCFLKRLHHLYYYQQYMNISVLLELDILV